MFHLACSYGTLAAASELGAHIEQERQLFHDLTRLGKKIAVIWRFNSAARIQSTLLTKNGSSTG
jgi:hypothetical protein